MHRFSYRCANAEETAKYAATLAPMLRAGDVLLLHGPLAAGKTFFVQALARALGSASRVSSPTFGIANFYPLPEATLLHIDAYRLTGVPEFRDLGLADYTTSGITAIKWGERVESEFPNRLAITFDFVEDQDGARELTAASSSPRWLPVLETLRGALQGVAR